MQYVEPHKSSMPIITNVRGPYKDGNSYIVRWTEDGRNRTKSGTSIELTKLRNKLRGAMPKGGPCRLEKRNNFGTPEYFKQSLKDALDANLDAVNIRDFDAIKATQQRVDILKKAWETLAPVMGHQNVGATLEKVMNYLESHGHLTEIEGATELVATDPKLAEALASPLGPFEALSGHGDAIPIKGRSARGDAH